MSPSLPPLILASTSRYRKALLARLQLPFQTETPGVDESSFHPLGLSPRALAEKLAEAKSGAVAKRHPNSVVIGSDQLAAIDGTVLGKPGTAERACDQLRLLRGREHELITSVCLHAPQGRWVHTDITRLRLRSLSDAEIKRYIEQEAPLDCAGSYKIEGLGISLFERVESEDATAIEGLPLLALCRGLRSMGFPLP